MENNNHNELPDNPEAIQNQIDLYNQQIDEYLAQYPSVDVHVLSARLCTSYRDSRRIVDECQSFHNEIENELLVSIADTTHQLDRTAFQLNQVTYALEILDGLKSCNDRYEAHSRLKNDPSGRIASLNDFATSLDDLSILLRGCERLNMFTALQSAQDELKQQSFDCLTDSWNCIVQLSKNTDGVTIRVTRSDMKGKRRLLDALIASGHIKTVVEAFSRDVLMEILNPLIQKNATVEVVSSGDCDVLKVAFVSQKKAMSPPYVAVLDNLKRVIDFLSENLGEVMRTIGGCICDEFADALIKNCLMQTIPNCISELQDYGAVTSQVEQFQKYLTTVDFFSAENVSILHYANNIDVLFANKTSQYFLENARNILKKDLSNTMSVGCESPVEEQPASGDDMLVINDDDDNAELLNYFFGSFRVSPFRFPRCAISKSVHELLDLVILMMEQAVEASDLCARRLYYTARNVFELYIAIVPLHHKQFLDTMPQQVALFHNNSMYLAHHLLMLGIKWQKNFAERKLEYKIIFCDLVKELRDLASRTILTHLQLQKKQLLDTIKASDLYYIAIKDSLSDNAEQAIRQCIRQLQVLKTIWSGIFPADIYRRLVTCLADVLVEELVSKVIIQEDITAEVATQLADLYKLVMNRLPRIYDATDEEHAIEEKAIRWSKLNELTLILSGSLATIEERWGNGSGPLAAQFTPEQIKRLIRALFQNTTFRASLLNKIK